MSKSLLLPLSTAILCFAPQIRAQGDDASANFVVGDISITGLQRISEGTVYNYLPINIGDRLDTRRIDEAVRALYGTGFFRDIELRRDGHTLVVAVLERPSIESFEIKGNKDIKTEDLQSSLRNVGLAGGKTFDRSVLEEVKQYLTDQYYSRGKYAVQIEAKVEEAPDNKVRIAIDIAEGKRAGIAQINIVGNQAFTDDQLRSGFQLSTGNWLSWFRQDDRYAREALSGDLESLRSYYMDRGYADFQIESTQVAIAPEKDDIYLTLNVNEGEVYRISDVKLAGTMVVPEKDLMPLLQIGQGELFSQRRITQSSELIASRLGLDGYAFARIDPVPQINPDTHEISLTFLIDPGNRVYVRRINFHGSTSVNDEVFRREMRQLEGSYLSNSAVERSKERIQRLPYIEKAEVKTTPVAGTPDLVDVDFDIKEGLPGQIGGGIGYSESQKLTLNADLIHSNFLGTGERVALRLYGGAYNKVYEISHTDPYATMDGISRTMSLSYRDVTQLTSESSDLSTETSSFSVSYGYPITEHQSVNLGMTFQRAELVTSEYSSTQLQDWVSANGDSWSKRIDGFDVMGTSFDSLQLTGGWGYDSRDRVLFPTRGANHQLSFSAAMPVSDVDYFTANYRFRQFFRLPYLSWLPFSFGMHLGYAGTFGDTTAIPPYANFLLGGPDSVRGFKESTLGPKDSLGNPFGGDAVVSGQIEVLLPTPPKFANSMQASLFYDFGQLAYLGDAELTDKGGFPLDYDFDYRKFRTSAGIAVQWLAPMGLFRFSFAFPLTSQNSTELLYGDETERFQFSIGNAF